LYNFAPEDSDMGTEDYCCPICNKGQNRSLRHSNYVCHRCVANAVDENGRRIRFANQSMGGGIVVYYVDTGEIRKSNICYISGVRCRADEARFDGIVVQIQDDDRF
jgi:hypothetical protein